MPFDEEEPVENEPQAEDNRPKRPGPILHTPKSGPKIPFKLILPVVLIIAIGGGGYWYYKHKHAAAEPPPAVVSVPNADTTQQMAPANQPIPVETTTTAPQQKISPRSKKQKAIKTEMAANVKTKTKAPKKEVKKEPEASGTRSSDAAPKLSSADKGNFTIFVGSFKEKKNADAVYQRWKDAGYPAMMTTKGAWHRVSLGKYPSKADASKEAKKMKDAFENGYFVGVLE